MRKTRMEMQKTAMLKTAMQRLMVLLKTAMQRLMVLTLPQPVWRKAVCYERRGGDNGRKGGS
jgi:hypothetical protein